jgi:O-antigen/teichoic acid export membrane protein
MAHMLTRVRALPRRLLHGGAPGDARTAGGRQIASNMAVQLAARGITMAIGVITVSLTARTLDPKGYGVLNGTASYVGLFAAFTDLGFMIAVTQRMAAEPERESAWLGALMGARTTLALVATAACALTIPLLNNVDDTHIVGWITTLTILSGGPQSLMALFQSRLRAPVILTFSLAQSVLWLFIVLGLAATGGTTVEFAAANVCVLVIIGVLQIRTTRRFAHIAWREGRKLWRSLLGVALPMGLASAFIIIYLRIDSVLLLQKVGPHEAGIYAASYQFLTPLILLPAAVMGSIFPVISAVYPEDRARVDRLVQIGADFMAIISLPILAFAIALADPIIHLLYGPGYARSAGLLPILMIAFVSICYGNLAGYLAPILGLQWRLAAYSAIGAVLNVLLNLLLIPPYRAYGSAWATVATEIITMGLMLATVLWGLRLRLRIGKIGRTVILAAAMTAVMTLASPLGLIPAAAVGVAFYAGGLVALRIISADELRRLRPSATA